MKQTPFTIDLRPVRSEIISADEYIRLTKESPGLIARAEFVPPRQGRRGFGSFLVRYSRARNRVMEHG